MADYAIDLVSPLMHEAFNARVPDRELYQMPDEWFHVASGPVYGRVPVKPGDNNLIDKGTEGDGLVFGQRIRLAGQIVDSDGRGVPNALIETWQANSSGRYADAYCNRPWLPLDGNFTGAGRCLTDSEGRYEFLTIRPSGYAGPAGSGMWRAAHIHFSVIGQTFANRILTSCYFENDPLLTTDFVLDQVHGDKGKSRLVAAFNEEDTGVYENNLQVGYTWDLVLRGPKATPLES